MKKALKRIAAAIVILFTLALAAVATVLSFPRIVVNDRLLRYVPRLAAGAGVTVSWKDAHLSAESAGFLSKKLVLRFSGLCVTADAGALEVCFKDGEVAAIGGLSELLPRVTEIGPVELRGGKVLYDARKTEAAEDTSGKKAGSSAFPPASLAGAKLGRIQIDVPSWRVVTSADTFVGDLTFDGSGKENNGGVELVLQSHAGAQRSRQRAMLRLALDNSKDDLSLNGWKVDTTMNYRQSKALAAGRIQGVLSSDGFDLSISADAKRMIPNVKRVWVNSCDLRLKKDGGGSAVALDCPVRFGIPVPPKGFPPVAVPTRAGARITAKLKSGAFPPDANSELRGSVDVLLDPVLTPIFRGEGKIRSEIAGVPGQFPKNWKFGANFGVGLSIPRFERLVRRFRDTPFDVWAPFRALRGQVAFAIHGNVEPSGGDAPIRFHTHLVSRRQVFDLDTTGALHVLSLRPSVRAHVDLDVSLNDVRLELPPLPELPSPTHPKIENVPQLLPDDRIQDFAASKPSQMAGATEKAPAPPTISYDLHVHTRDDQHPVRLLTSRVKAPIPVGLDLRVSDAKPLSGEVRVLAFPLELFRRQVRLDHLDIALAPPPQPSSLDGRVEVQYADYDITVFLLGTVDKPQLRFQSDPPLPDDQIVAALVFGRPLDTLDADQQQSVGSSRAALQEGAFSLLSLYYLSSTDIERVDYDPDTHTASLSYRLAEGTSLNVSQGVSGGEPSVGVRKRLNKHLSVTTTLNNPSEEQPNRTVSVFLNWAYQY